MPDTDFLEILKARRTPVVKDGAAHLVGSGYAFLTRGGEKAVLADPLSEKVASDDAAMTHRFRISSPCLDRAGDVVRPLGCLAVRDGKPLLDRYRKNPQVLFGHDSRAFPVARSRDGGGAFGVDVREDGIFGTAEFHGSTYESEKCYELIKLGYLNATSIGFNPLKARLLPDTRPDPRRGELNFQYPGLDFEEWELMEWSVVPVPCNPEALDGLKGWVGKAAGGDSPLLQSIKAMLATDGGASVTVSVPADPPPAPVPTIELKVEPVVTLKEVPVTFVSGVALEPFTPSEVEAVVGQLTAPKVEVRELVVEDPRVAALAAKLAELEARFAGAAAKNAEALKELPVPAEPPAPEPEAEAEAAPKATPPVGAWVLLKGKKELDELYHLIEAKLPQVDNPKTCAFLDDLHADLDALMGKVQKFGRKQYPDWFPKDADDPKAAPAEVEKAAVSGPAGTPVASPPVWTPEMVAAAQAALGKLAALAEQSARSVYRLTGR